MSPRPLLLISLTFGLAVAPAVSVAQVRLTAAQQAHLASLTERLGACHRRSAWAQAGTKFPVDRIVAAALAACRPQLATLRAEMVRLGGAEAADASLARQRPHWQESIRRNVAAARAKS